MVSLHTAGWTSPVFTLPWYRRAHWNDEDPTAFPTVGPRPLLGKNASPHSHASEVEPRVSQEKAIKKQKKKHTVLNIQGSKPLNEQFDNWFWLLLLLLV